MAKVLSVPGVHPEETNRANFARIVPVRLAELLAWERWIEDPRNVLELHQMRIAAKRLRYTMELAAPSFGTEFGAAIKQIKSIQELLGTIHDADVLTPQLRDSLRDLLQGEKRAQHGAHCADFAAAQGLLTACRIKLSERDATYSEFVELWRRLRADGFFESLRRLTREDAATPEERVKSGRKRAR